MPGEDQPRAGQGQHGHGDGAGVRGRGRRAADSQVIAIDPVTIQNMGIRTAMVTRGPLRRIIRTVGVIDYNETALADVTTKFKGWIEKLYVDSTGQQVHRGEPLFEIYSPELYSAQSGVSARAGTGDQRPGGAALKASARTKLKFFDISDEQIAELERTRQPRKTLRIVAPQDGFVMEKMVVEGQMVDAGHEDLPAGRPGAGLGAGADLRAGPGLPEAGPGGDGEAVLSAGPRVPRARDLHLSDRG